MKEKEHFEKAKNLLTRRKPNDPPKKEYQEDSKQPENHFTLSKTGDIVSKDQKEKFYNTKPKESYHTKEDYGREKRDYKNKKDTWKNDKYYNERDYDDYEEDNYNNNYNNDSYNQDNYRKRPRRGKNRKQYNKPVYVKKGEETKEEMDNQQKEEQFKNKKSNYKKKKPRYQKIEKKNDEGSNPYFKKNLFDVLSKD